MDNAKVVKNMKNTKNTKNTNNADDANDACNAEIERPKARESIDDYIPQAVFSVKNFIVGMIEESTDGKKDQSNPCSHTFDFPGDYAPLKTITFSTRARDPQKSLDFPSVNRVVITYEKGTVLSEQLLNKCKSLIERYILIFAIENKVDLNDLKVTLETYSYFDKKHGQVMLTVHQGMKISEELFTFCKYSAKTYKDALDDSLLGNIEYGKNVDNTEDIQEALDDDFSMLKAIYDVENIESRYLLQYEFLKYLVAGLFGKIHGSQAQVKKFVEGYYNPQETVNWKKIGTTVDNRGETKDLLTFYRNVIGHPPVTDSEKSRFTGTDLPLTFQEWPCRVSEVILFAIREKARLNRASCQGL